MLQLEILNLMDNINLATANTIILFGQKQHKLAKQTYHLEGIGFEAEIILFNQLIKN